MLATLFSYDNADYVFFSVSARINRSCASHNVLVTTLLIFIPDASKAEEPVILQRFGKPYLAMLDKRNTTTSSKKSPIRVMTPNFVKVEK